MMENEETKRSLGRYSKSSEKGFGEISLELAKIYVSYKVWTFWQLTFTKNFHQNIDPLLFVQIHKSI